MKIWYIFINFLYQFFSTHASMNKTYSIITILLVLSIALSGCSSITGNVVVEDCELLKNPALKDECYVEYAVSKVNQDYCKSIEDSMSVDYCYQKVAVAQKDSGICKNIKSI